MHAHGCGFRRHSRAGRRILADSDAGIGFYGSTLPAQPMDF
jgi:hypothetical protein